MTEVLELAAGRVRHGAIADAVDAARARALRERVDAAGYVAYDEPDRGRYEVNRDHVERELFEQLRALAEPIVDRPLAVGGARWSRLRHGDYALTKDNLGDRASADTFVEVTLDFSAHATAQAETTYTDGVATWEVAQIPHRAVIVERPPWLFRHDRYLNLAVGAMIVHRLRLALLVVP